MILFACACVRVFLCFFPVVGCVVSSSFSILIKEIFFSLFEMANFDL